MNENECRLTLEQIQALASGRMVRVSYSTLEEYGFVADHKIELVPPDINSIDSRSPYDAGLGPLSRR